jgi:hypothetical protein
MRWTTCLISRIRDAKAIQVTNAPKAAPRTKIPMMAQRSFISDYLCTEKENPHILEGKFTKSEKIAVASPWSHCSSELYRNGNISDAHFAADSTPPGEDADPDFSMLKQAKEDYVKLQWRLCSVPGCKSCFEHVSSLRPAGIARACSLQQPSSLT